jgi:glycosyltransferase involved in cell wall biosynthesis
MKTFTFISQYFYPSHTSTAQLLTDLSLNLSTSGHTILVLTSTPSNSALPPVNITRTYSRFHQGHSISSKALASLAFLLSGLGYVLRLPKSTSLLIASNPPYAGLLGLAFKYLKGGQYTFLFQDIFPESAALSGVLKSNGLLYHFFQRLMSFICHQAKCTIVLTPAMQTYLEEKQPHLQGKLQVIENWAVEAIHPQPKAENPFAQQHGLDKIFTVLYSGNIGRLHDIETIAEAIYLLRDQPIQFVFIGDGPKRSILTNYQEKYQLTNLVLLPFQPRQQLPHTLTACDLSLVSLIPGAEQIVAPCKLYGMLAAGRAILSLSTPGSYLDQLLNQHHCGINLAPGDPDRLAQTIKTLSTQTEYVATLGHNAHQLYQQYYHIDRAAKQYEALLLGRSSPQNPSI